MNLREWMAILPFLEIDDAETFDAGGRGRFVLGLEPAQGADEGKKETIKGDGLCGKCALKETKTCQNVVIVTKDGKKTNYYLEKNEFFKDAHGGLGICTATKDEPIKVKVTGTVVKKDDKLILTPPRRSKSSRTERLATRDVTNVSSPRQVSPRPELLASTNGAVRRGIC